MSECIHPAFKGSNTDLQGSRSYGSLTREFIRNQGMECCCFFFWMLWLASAIADRTDEADLGGSDGIHVVGTQRAGRLRE
jgi:hypothetical protein